METLDATMLTGAVSSLRDKLEARATEVGVFVDGVEADASALERTAQDKLKEMQERLATLKSKKEELESMSWANEKRLEAESAKVGHLQSTLAELRDQENAASNGLRGANERQGKVLDKVKRLEEETTAAVATQQDQVNHLTRGAKMYKTLGMEFSREEPNSRLKVSFTQVDPADHDRVFSFKVFVDQSDTYHVEQVEPDVGNIAELTKQLNKTNDFSLFVRSMRKKFQALC